MKIDLDKLMNAKTGDRSNDLHVQIGDQNKAYLRSEAKSKGIVMGLFLDKLLSLMREAKRNEKARG